jgi:prepilin-type N-terminal cleavage/methylation domain-containing protein
MLQNTKLEYPNRSGFTIVELLIVIVVIGILVGLALLGYNGVQKQARETKIQADITQLKDAIDVARQKTRKTLPQITGTFQTAVPCVLQPPGTDLAKLSRSEPCWANYLKALKAISAAGGVDVSDLTDPWGRPYFIDENESEISAGDPPGYPGHCYWDTVTAYNYPLSGSWVNSDYKAAKIGPNNLEPSGFTQCTSAANGP